jgi:hypothetical protein
VIKGKPMLSKHAQLIRGHQEEEIIDQAGIIRAVRIDRRRTDESAQIVCGDASDWRTDGRAAPCQPSAMRCVSDDLKHLLLRA